MRTVGFYQLNILCISIISLVFVMGSVLLDANAQMPPSIKDSESEPMKYIGNLQPDKHFYDGKF